MRRRPRWLLPAMLAAAAALVVVLATTLKGYYDARYVEDRAYYTVIPRDYDYTPHRVLDSQGVERDWACDYLLTCYDADGAARELEFRAMLRYQELYPPGTYVRVSVSQASVLGQRALDRSEVPEEALERLDVIYQPTTAATLPDYALEQSGYLSRRETPSLGIGCRAEGDALVYTYTYDAQARELAEDAAVALDLAYRAQFRADKDACPGLSAIYLEVRLSDGTLLFTQKYDRRVTYGYDGG